MRLAACGAVPSHDLGFNLGFIPIDLHPAWRGPEDGHDPSGTDRGESSSCTPIAAT